MLSYNNKPISDSDSCPDPRLLLPEILKKIGEVSRLKICEARKDSFEYTDVEIAKLRQIVDSISNGIDSGTLEKITKITTIFNEIDTDKDGNLNELIELIDKVNTNITNISNLQNINNILDVKITNLVSRVSNLEDRIEILEQDTHTHELGIKQSVCQLSKNLVQAMQAGLAKFELEMNKECDVVLSNNHFNNNGENSELSSDISQPAGESSAERSDEDSNLVNLVENVSDTSENLDSPIL